MVVACILCMHTYHMNECMCVQYCVCFANVIFWLVFLFVLYSAKHRSYTHACTCVHVLVYVLLCGCLLACATVTSLQETVLCVLCEC